MGEMRNAYKSLGGKAEGNKQVRGVGVDGMIILKLVFKK
jgi:hypothetical protein